MHIIALVKVFSCYRYVSIQTFVAACRSSAHSKLVISEYYLLPTYTSDGCEHMSRA